MIGRPQQTEAASFYFNYIDQAPGDDPLDLLTSQLNQLESFFATISEDRSLYRYAPDK